MTPASPPGCRLSLLGSAVGCVAAALTLSACGGGGTSAPTAASSTSPKPAAQSAVIDRRCQAQLDGFVKSLDALRSSLTVGLSYEQYAAEVHTAMAAYGEIPVGQLTIGCLSSAGTPSEKALDKYIDAANAWGECLGEAGCDTTTVEPALQRRWRVASNYLSAAQSRQKSG